MFRIKWHVSSPLRYLLKEFCVAFQRVRDMSVELPEHQRLIFTIQILVNASSSGFSVVAVIRTVLLPKMTVSLVADYCVSAFRLKMLNLCRKQFRRFKFVHILYCCGTRTESFYHLILISFSDQFWETVTSESVDKVK